MGWPSRPARSTTCRSSCVPPPRAAICITRARSSAPARWSDGRAIPYEIRKGVWVVFEAATEYQKNCFEEYMLCTDPSGRYSVMYKRWHLIGLEVGMSVASIGLRKEPTGCPIGFH